MGSVNTDTREVAEVLCAPKPQLNIPALHTGAAAAEMRWCVHGVKQPKALPVPDHRLLSTAKLGAMARTGTHVHPHARMCPQWGTGAVAVGQV